MATVAGEGFRGGGKRRPAACQGGYRFLANARWQQGSGRKRLDYRPGICSDADSGSAIKGCRVGIIEDESGGFEEPVSKVSSQEPGRTLRDDLRHQPFHHYGIRSQIPSFRENGNLEAGVPVGFELMKQALETRHYDLNLRCLLGAFWPFVPQRSGLRKELAENIADRSRLVPNGDVAGVVYQV